MTKVLKEEIFAFIDSTNLYLGIKNQGWELDYVRFREYLRAKYNVTRAYLFIGYVPGNESLYMMMQEAGFILVLKPTLAFANNGKQKIKGNVDAELVLHCVSMIKKYSSAVIVSGDGDFYCLLSFLKKKGKLSKVLVPSWRCYSALLREYAEFVAVVEEQQSKLERKGRAFPRH